MKPTATTHKAWGRTPRYCRKAGCNACTVFRAPPREGRVGYCLDVVDLFLSKAAAGRDKDRLFCIALLQHGHVELAQAIARLLQMPLDDAGRRRLRTTITRWSKVATAS